MTSKRENDVLSLFELLSPVVPKESGVFQEKPLTYHRRGHWFKSSIAHHIYPRIVMNYHKRSCRRQGESGQGGANHIRQASNQIRISGYRFKPQRSIIVRVITIVDCYLLSLFDGLQAPENNQVPLQFFDIHGIRFGRMIVKRAIPQCDCHSIPLWPPVEVVAI